MTPHSIGGSASGSKEESKKGSKEGSKEKQKEGLKEPASSWEFVDPLTHDKETSKEDMSVLELRMMEMTNHMTDMFNKLTNHMSDMFDKMNVKLEQEHMETNSKLESLFERISKIEGGLETAMNTDRGVEQQQRQNMESSAGAAQKARTEELKKLREDMDRALEWVREGAGSSAAKFRRREEIKQLVRDEFPGLLVTNIDREFKRSSDEFRRSDHGKSLINDPMMPMRLAEFVADARLHELKYDSWSQVFMTKYLTPDSRTLLHALQPNYKEIKDYEELLLILFSRLDVRQFLEETREKLLNWETAPNTPVLDAVMPMFYYACLDPSKASVQNLRDAIKRKLEMEIHLLPIGQEITYATSFETLYDGLISRYAPQHLFKKGSGEPQGVSVTNIHNSSRSEVTSNKMKKPIPKRMDEDDEAMDHKINRFPHCPNCYCSDCEKAYEGEEFLRTNANFRRMSSQYWCEACSCKKCIKLRRKYKERIIAPME